MDLWSETIFSFVELRCGRSRMYKTFSVLDSWFWFRHRRFVQWFRKLLTFSSLHAITEHALNYHRSRLFRSENASSTVKLNSLTLEPKIFFPFSGPCAKCVQVATMAFTEEALATTKTRRQSKVGKYGFTNRSQCLIFDFRTTYRTLQSSATKTFRPTYEVIRKFSSTSWWMKWTWSSWNVGWFVAPK